MLNTARRDERDENASVLPIAAVAGFLGAGKTTLMRHLLRDAAGRGLKVAVIVNEFGIADIDSNILREGGAELLSSVAGGCACCSGQEDFLFTLLDVATRRGAARPDVVLVEASGLADPIALLDSLTIAKLLPLVRLGALISVVDSARFLLVRDEALPLLCRQVQLADFIIANKIDIAFRSEDRGTRAGEVVAQLRALNAHAAIVPAKGCAIDLEPVWRRVFDGMEDEGAVLQEHRLSSAIPHASDAAHAHYQTVVCPLPHPVERAHLEAALQGLGPRVWRAKGFVRLRGEDGLHLVQYVGGWRGGECRGEYRIAPFAVHAPDAEEPATALVFIGPALERQKLSRDFAGGTPLTMV